MCITNRTRILLIFVGCALIQALLLGSFFLSRHFQFQRNQINKQLHSLSTDLTSQVESYGKIIFQDLHATNLQGTNPSLAVLSELQNCLDRILIPSDFNLYILNGNGIVVAAKNHEGDIIKSFDATQRWDGEITINGVHFFSVSSPLNFNKHRFLAVTTIDRKALLAPSKKTVLLFFISSIFIFLFALFVGWKTNKRILVPLQEIGHSTKALLLGKDSKLLENGDTESLDVAHDIEVMNSHLQESNKRLEKEIFHRKRDEKMAIQAQIDAEKANQAKSIFLANMSHEIRTPLHAILALINMLGNESLNSKQQKMLSMASVSGQRLQTLVDSILDFSLIESGKIELHNTIFSLSKLLTEVIELMQVSAKDKNLLLEINQAPEIHDTLKGDSGRLRQILINLLNNAIKHTHKGTISLAVEINKKTTDKEIVLLFSIKDSGHGISNESQLKIFNPFEQGLAELGKITEGIGLGLAISKEFVHYMQGEIWLEQSDENGSTFCFTICCEKEAKPTLLQEKVSETNPLPMKLADIRILLAEDDFINQRIISAYLQEYGASVEVCENGEVLLEKMEHENPDIILMDIRMPILDGIETTKRIRQQETEPNQSPVPIIALTAEASYDIKQKCLAAGMNGYLTKPIPLNDLTILIIKLHKERA